MQILILANNDIGLYKFRKELIEELLQRGNKVMLSLPYGDYVPKLIECGCEFIDTAIDRRGINPFTDLKLLCKYVKLLQEVKPDLVITYTIKPNIYGGYACRRKKYPYVINITGIGTAFQKDGLLKKLIMRLYQIACKNAKLTFFQNEENRQLFIRHKLVNPEKTVCLMGSGVNLKDYPYCEYPWSEELHFLYVGRIMKEKGVEELLAAAKRIKANYSNVRFDIVGTLEEDYEEVLKELERQEIIKYYGYQEDVRPFIEQCHCFVLPSYHEGMANTLLEAAAMGRPLITSDIAGCREVIFHQKNGYLVKKADTDSLYYAMEEFINQPLEERREMGVVSRRYMEVVFDKKDVVRQIIANLYL